MGLGCPLVSVIMPSFNTGHWIEQAISSVCAQTFDNWELLIVDDCSTDDSLEKILTWTHKDSRITVVRSEQKQGPVDARNRALAIAQGRFVAFCDSDDVWLPEKLERQLEMMATNKQGICCTAYHRINEEGATIGGPIIPPSLIGIERLLLTNDIGMSTSLIDMGICGPIQLPNIPRRQDYALWVTLVSRGHFVVGIPEPLVSYRVRRNSLSSNKCLGAYYHWRVLRDFASLSVVKALPKFICYVWAAFKKRTS